MRAEAGHRDTRRVGSVRVVNVERQVDLERYVEHAGGHRRVERTATPQRFLGKLEAPRRILKKIRIGGQVEYSARSDRIFSTEARWVVIKVQPSELTHVHPVGRLGIV
eukprot:7299377-Prymnesium_polylepis.1